MSPERKELAIFPLGAVVLFPGFPMEIRVFEERYKKLVADVQSSDSKIGIVLIKEGNEVGDTAEPYLVGTQSRIVATTCLDNGLIFLSLLGENRFKIIQILTEYPYQRAEIEPIEELSDQNVASDLIRSATEAFNQYLTVSRILEGSWTNQLVEETDSTKLSYLIAHTMLAEPLVKQGLLEISGVVERLEIEEKLLRRGTERLRQRLIDHGPQSRFGKN